MISLTIYFFLWILALVFFFMSFMTSGGKRVIFNVFSFILFFMMALVVDVHTTNVVALSNSTATISGNITTLVTNSTSVQVQTHLEGVKYLQYLAWLFTGVCIIRGIQHAYLAFVFRGDN